MYYSLAVSWLSERLVPRMQWKRAALVGPPAQSIRDAVDIHRLDQTTVASQQGVLLKMTYGNKIDSNFTR